MFYLLSRAQMVSCSDTLKNCLWEYNVDELTSKDDIVIVRALQYGEISDIRSFEALRGKDYVINILTKYSHYIDKKSLNLWSQYYKLDNLQSSSSLYEQLNKPTFTRSFGH